MEQTQTPQTFEASDPMPDEYRELLLRVLKVAADTETSLLFPESDWLKGVMDLAPTPEDRLKMSRFYAEELTHGYYFYTLLRNLDVTPTAADYATVRQLYFAQVPLDTWTDVALLNCLTDRVGLFQYQNMEGCSYAPLARIVAKIARDEVGHIAMGYHNLTTICGHADGKASAQALLFKWYPVALDMFGRSDSRREPLYKKWRLKRLGNEELRRAYINEVRPLLEGLGLEVPDERSNRRFL